MNDNIRGSRPRGAGRGGNGQRGGGATRGFSRPNPANNPNSGHSGILTYIISWIIYLVKYFNSFF